MFEFARSVNFWRVTSACFFVAAIGVLFIGCSSIVPAFQSDIETVRADQAASAEAAEKGDFIRATLSGLLALAGSASYAVSRQRRYDKAPFEGTVGGETVKVTEDEVVKAVALAKSEGKIV
jgi:hypothetical protein